MSRPILILVAFVSLSMAFFLVLNADLPERTWYSQRTDELPFGLDIGSTAPTFVAYSLYGDTMNLVQLRGIPTIINFWATWCEPCRVEMSILQGLYDQFRERGVHIVAVNLGEGETAVRDWVTEMGITLPVVLDEHQQVSKLFWLRGVPSTYVIAPDGLITAIFYGPTTESQLQTAIAPHLVSSYTLFRRFIPGRVSFDDQ
jgi:peroxiredoxin